MKKVVTLGGGTGNFTVLRGLKKYNLDLTAIVSMADDGGSTGILRDELGVLPPGDVRQCLVALSDSSKLMRNLMNYRFENGSLGGHNFGNLLLSALEKVTGSFEHSIEEVSKILSIKGKVLPITTNQVRLKMILDNNKTLHGEREIYASTEIDNGFRSLFLEPIPKVNPRAIDEIMNADLVVIGPGGLHSSIIPVLLVEGVSKALRETKAEKVFVINLMNRKGQTTSFKATDHLKELRKFIGKDVFDSIVINNGLPPGDLVEAYAQEGNLVINDFAEDERVICTDLLSHELKERQNGDLLKRNLIRHDHKKLSQVLMGIVNEL
ncbi:YvcK family protein [Candidatus Woesearchaeota archaeon]|nr:YvcK family protein [Candidatus Woesearchaeota archaeon]